ncbi:MAG: amidohydrolase family protein [Candidatus Brockarchaeota archaeon]|nr:amidohydrolase family protein [Candidatus Brockarchaeota archaeon]
MIIDFNAYLGQWPFRRLPARTADEVLAIMDRHGITMSAVSSLSSVLYADPQDGNLELMEEIEKERKRFVPLAVLNPKYPGWESDLDECVSHGFRGIRLYPQSHDYALTDEECLKLVSRASEAGLSVSVPVRLRDGRGRHWMDRARDLKLSEVEQLARRVPGAKIVLLESRDVSSSPIVECQNVYFETSSMPSLLGGELAKLLRSVGASRLVFGSGTPLKYALPAILKVKLLDGPEEAKEKILWSNASRLLGLG